MVPAEPKEDRTMPEYMLSVFMSEDAVDIPEDEMQQMFKDVDVVNAELQAAGAWVFGGGLEPADTATVVSAQTGDVLHEWKRFR